MIEPRPTISGRTTYSPVVEDDFEFLVTLRIAAMRESLEQLGRFDPARARERLRKSFAPQHTQFIEYDRQRVGFYTLRPSDDGHYLDHFYVHPSFQSLGIGSEVLQRLLVQADLEQADVRLCALRDSRANRFYQRHGFSQTAEDEWDIHYLRRHHL
jgi:ribosomal protein S18 acetylase RimI-like enzyme